MGVGSCHWFWMCPWRRFVGHCGSRRGGPNLLLVWGAQGQCEVPPRQETWNDMDKIQQKYWERSCWRKYTETEKLDMYNHITAWITLLCASHFLHFDILTCSNWHLLDMTAVIQGHGRWRRNPTCPATGFVLWGWVPGCHDLKWSKISWFSHDFLYAWGSICLWKWGEKWATPKRKPPDGSDPKSQDGDDLGMVTMALGLLGLPHKVVMLLGLIGKS